MKKNRSFLIAAIFFPTLLIFSSSVFADWYLDNIELETFKDKHENSNLPIDGSKDVIVAIIDSGINCDDPALSGKCIDMPVAFNATARCAEYYNRGRTSEPVSAHGTTLARLIAGNTSSGSNISGVAPNTKILPLSYRSIRGSSVRLNLAGAIECAALSEAKIINISLEANHDSSLQTATCNAICSNKLVVASAGNGACDGKTDRFPASYSDDDDLSCSCSDHSLRKMKDSILKVGGSNSDDNIGEACSNENSLTTPFGGTLYYKSQAAEIYAPGWGVPNDDDNSFNYGTSWSTALVSGCAAIRVAFDLIKSDFVWDSNAVVELEHVIISTATKNDHNESFKLLNCSKVFEDSIPDDEEKGHSDSKDD